MAARFWVGGTGNLDGSTTTNISATSGGSGGASYPVAGDTLTFDGSSGGGTVTFTAALSITTLTMGAFTGTINTNGQSVTVSGTFSGTGTATRTLTLGASAISCGTWLFATTTNLTFNANTSTITVGASTFSGGGLTYATVTGGSTAITGANTFGTLTRTGAASKTDSMVLFANQTVTGTLTINGNSAVNRPLIATDVRGTSRTITAGTVTVTNADFLDITGAGAGSWNLSAITGGSGDCGGNSGITFTTPATQYWQHGASASYNWSDSSRWFLATNGGGGAGRVPLPQDGPAIFDANSFGATGKTVVADMTRNPGLDMTGVTNSPTFNLATSASFYGSVTLVSGVPLSDGGGWTYEGRGASTLTSAGKTWGKTFTINSASGTLTLADALTTTGNLSILGGNFDGAGYNVTAASFVANSTATRTISMGTGATYTVTGNIALAVNMVTTGLTLNAGTSTIKLTGAFTAARTFAGGGFTFYNVWNATTGAFALQFTGSNTFNEVRHDSGRTWLLTAGTTTTLASLVADGVTIGSITAASHTLTKTGGGTVTVSGATISRSTATPGSTFYATGASTDGGNNSGWTFGAPSITTEATAAYSTWVAPAATARLRLTTQATASSSTWTAPSATAQTRYTVSASAASSSWVAPSAAAQMARRRAISVLCSVSGYSIGLSAPALADIPCSSSSYQIEVS